MRIVHMFVSYAHVGLCHFFSSSSCRELTATSACGSSWTFLFTFIHFKFIFVFSENCSTISSKGYTKGNSKFAEMIMLAK